MAVGNYGRYSPVGGSGVGGGVTSVNSEVGALTIAGGTGISVTNAGTTITVTNTAPSSGGTVTSVGLADASTSPIFSISGSPVTTSGTLTLTLNTASANTFFAGPTSGSAAQPTFRAIGNSDLTGITTLSALSLPYSQVTGGPSGTVTSVGLSAPALFTVSGSPVTSSGTLALSYSGTALPVANGGTGLSTIPANSVMLGEGTSNVSTVSSANSGQVLQGNGASSAPTFTSSPTLGLNGTGAGSLVLAGSTSGAVTINPGNAAAGTYNFNLPTSAGTSGQPLLSGGGGSTAQIYGTLSVSGGGTGFNTLASGAVLLGNGTSGINQVSPVAGAVLTYVGGSYGNSATPTLGAVGTLGILNLSGNTSGTVNIKPQAAAGSWSFILPSSGGTSGQPLLSGAGSATSWGTVGVAAGGTGLTTLTANNLIVGNGTGNPNFIAPGANGNILQSNGTVWQSVTQGFPANYAQAYFDYTNNWTTTSTTFADPTFTGGGNDTLTVRQSNNITLTAAASDLPGITFTPSSAQAVYLISVSAGVYSSVAGGGTSVRLTDGTTVVAVAPEVQTPVGATDSIVITGVYVPGTTNAVTLKLQVAASSGTSGLGSTVSPGVGIEWSVVQLSTSGATTGPAFIYGGGSDGAVTISGTTTLTRDMYYSNLTMANTGVLNTNGFRVFVNGLLDITAAQTGAIITNGGAGNAGLTAGTGGTAGAVPGIGTLGGGATIGGAGGAGGTTTGSQGSAGAAASPGLGGSSGATLAGGTGSSGAGGALRASVAPVNGAAMVRYVPEFIRGVSLYTGGCSGNGGSGGGGDGTAGGGGGGGGAGAGILSLLANTIARGTNTNPSIIQAIGGAGGAGGAAVAGSRGGGSGGSGGGGGEIHIVYGALTGSTITNAVDASGGAGGAGGNGTNASGGAGSGGGGAGGRIDLFNATTGVGTESFGGTVQTPNAASGTTGGAQKAGQVTQANL